jgi:hypothetical protein
MAEETGREKSILEGVNMPRSKEKQEPLFDDPPFVGDEDLASENAELRDLLREAADQMPAHAEAGQKVITPAPVVALVMAVIVICRVVLYVVVEGKGTRSEFEALAMNVLFLVGWGWAFVSWLEQEWKELRWIAVMKAAVLLVGLLVFADTLTDGAIWSGHLGYGKKAVFGGGVLVMACCVVASSAIEKALARIVKVLR